ncbi:MAG: His-Xaa-Ser system radical SAM maturase HxsC [Tannerellaceae bacterium]|nr:His-Xaa-Ser system radical SAM maturase HxsC [Tannerellaceae bacterium]
MRDRIDIDSNDNSLFVTSQCNNRCLMCAQPPLQRDDVEYCFQKNLSLIQSAPVELPNIGITGGEPTLIGDKLIELIRYIRQYLPRTLIHILTNGRRFADIHYTKSLVTSGVDYLLAGVPLHSDYLHDHDLISQACGSYNETMKGLYNMARYHLEIELRIVINKINYKRLPKLATFIYKNLPFVKYISFMGLEDTGYSIKNQEQVWIDPVNYQNELEQAVLELAGWGMDVSVFNLPHCLLKESLYAFAQKSISDWKVKYMECCEECRMKNECCGLFSTSKKQSDKLMAI